MALSLVIGLGAALWQARVARDEARRAEEARQFISTVIAQAGPRQGSGGAVTAADLLAAAGQRLIAEHGADERSAAELGVAIGLGLSSLGEPQRGEAVLRAAVTQALRAYGPRHPLTLRARVLLSESLTIRAPDEALLVAETVLPDALAGLPASAREAVEALQQQSFLLAKRDQADPSIAALKQAAELADRHLGANHEDTAVALGLLSNTYGRFGQYPQQLITANDALARALAGLGGLRPHVSLTAVERWQAEALRRNDRPGDAVPILRRVVQDQRQLDGADTARVRDALYQLALALAETGELGEALPMMREVVALEARQNPVDNEDRRSFRYVHSVLLGFAQRADEALALLGDDASPPPLTGTPVAGPLVSRLRIARLRALTGDARGARELAEDVAAHARGPQAPLEAEAWHVAAFAARLQGRLAEAVALGERAWNHPARGQARPSIQAAIASELAAARLDRGETALAAAAVAQSLALYEQAQVRPSPRSSTAWIVQARLHLLAGRAVEAEMALSPLHDAWQAVYPQGEGLGETLHWLARAQRARGAVRAAQVSEAEAQRLLRSSRLPALRALARPRGAGL